MSELRLLKHFCTSNLFNQTRRALGQPLKFCDISGLCHPYLLLQKHVQRIEQTFVPGVFRFSKVCASSSGFCSYCIFRIFVCVSFHFVQRAVQCCPCARECSTSSRRLAASLFSGSNANTSLRVSPARGRRPSLIYNAARENITELSPGWVLRYCSR